MSAIAHWLLQLFGWKLVFVPPPAPKAVIIVYPHTSNWDFPVGILARTAIRQPIRFVGKHNLFRWPFGSVFLWLGGFPVDRSQSSGFIAQMQAEFDRHQRFFLAITPEGTRKSTTGWRSGFYRLALAARVPLGCAFIDYARREIGIRDYLQLSGDEAADLARIAAVYAGRRGKHPAQEGPIAFVAKSARGSH